MFSDGYSNAVISPVNVILTTLYPAWMDGSTERSTQNTRLLSAMGFAGSECGPLAWKRR